MKLQRILILGLLLLMGLAGCTKSEPAEEFVLPTPPQTETPTENPPEAPKETPDAEEALLAVRSGAVQISCYENFLWASSWTGDGWLSADGMSLFHQLSNLCNEFPEIAFCEDFSFLCHKDAVFSSFSVYNEAFERLHYNTQNLQVLEELPRGIYYLVGNVTIRGSWIEEEDAYEMTGYECACKLIISDAP